VFKGNVTTAFINFSMSKQRASRIFHFVTTYCPVLIVVMALTTLYFQRRDQRRAAFREVKTLADVIGDDHKDAESIDFKKRAKELISLP
jgi:hypothetical protein